MPLRTIPPESSWCRFYLILLQGSIPQLKQGASIMEVERRAGPNRFISVRTVPGRFPKILYVLSGAELRQSFYTVISFHFAAVSHQGLLELRGVSIFSHAEYTRVQGDFSAISRHNQPTTKRQAHRWCHLCSQCWIFIMKKRRFDPRSCPTCSTVRTRGQ
jgi:hypothetical protein